MLTAEFETRQKVAWHLHLRLLPLRHSQESEGVVGRCLLHCYTARMFYFTLVLICRSIFESSCFLFLPFPIPPSFPFPLPSFFGNAGGAVLSDSSAGAQSKIFSLRLRFRPLFSYASLVSLPSLRRRYEPSYLSTPPFFAMSV